MDPADDVASEARNRIDALDVRGGAGEDRSRRHAAGGDARICASGAEQALMVTGDPLDGRPGANGGGPRGTRPSICPQCSGALKDFSMPWQCQYCPPYSCSFLCARIHEDRCPFGFSGGDADNTTVVPDTVLDHTIPRSRPLGDDLDDWFPSPLQAERRRLPPDCITVVERGQPFGSCTPHSFAPKSGLAPVPPPHRPESPMAPLRQSPTPEEPLALSTPPLMPEPPPMVLPPPTIPPVAPRVPPLMPARPTSPPIVSRPRSRSRSDVHTPVEAFSGSTLAESDDVWVLVLKTHRNAKNNDIFALFAVNNIAVGMLESPHAVKRLGRDWWVCMRSRLIAEEAQRRLPGSPICGKPLKKADVLVAGIGY